MNAFSNDFLFNHSLITIDIIESDAYNSHIYIDVLSCNCQLL